MRLDSGVREFRASIASRRLRRGSGRSMGESMAMQMRRLAAATSLCAALLPALGSAQLTDITQTGPTVPGGAIGKSIDQQIGAGRGDIYLPQSSQYIIARDPARAVRRG